MTQKLTSFLQKDGQATLDDNAITAHDSKAIQTLATYEELL